MAVALLSYFSTMVTAFAALMFLLTSVFSSTAIHPVRPQAYRLSAMARAMASERAAAVTAKQPEIAQIQVPVSNSAAAHQASSDSVKDDDTRTAARQTRQARLLRLARDERRKERLAERHQDQGYSTMALGYAPESREQLAAARIFNTIGSRGLH
jgi:hypothetical protein